MARSKIEKMTFDEILKQVGTIMDPSYLQFVLKDYEDIRELREEIQAIVDNDYLLNIDPFIEFVKKYEDKIDKEKYVLAVAINTAQYMEQNNKNDKKLLEPQRLFLKVCEDSNQKARKLLENLQVEILTLEDKNGYKCIGKRFTTSQSINEQRYKNREQYEKIAEKLVDNSEISVAFKSNINLDDFEDFMTVNPKNGNIFRCIARNNVAVSLNGICKELNIVDDNVMLEDFKVTSSVAQYKRMVASYSDLLDIDKLMLVLAYRSKNRLENEYEELTSEEKKSCVKMMQFAIENILNEKVKISNYMFLTDHNKKVNVEYSLQKLKKDMENIIGDEYYSRNRVSDIRRNILSGEEDLTNVSLKQVFGLLNFSKKDKEKLIEQNPENFEYLLNMGALDNEEIEVALQKLGDYNLDLAFVNMLYVCGHIDEKKIIDLYMKENINIDTIAKLAELTDLENGLEVSDLLNYYDESQESEEKKKAFGRYSSVFWNVKMKNKTLQEQNEIAEEIIGRLYETDRDYDEDMKNLYDNNLLPIGTVIDWAGDEIKYKLIQTNTLHPADAKRLFLEGNLDLEKIKKYLKFSNLSDAEKLDFIYSSFDGIGENEEEIKLQDNAAKELLQTLGISENSNENTKSQGETREKGNSKGHSGNKYKSDPRYTWQLMSSIDKDYTKIVYPDGTVKFTFPNVKNGTVLIEKMFEKSKEGTRVSYGYATYVMSKEEFDKNESTIMKNNKISRRSIRELGSDKYEDFWHFPSWGDDLMEYLGVNERSQYSEKDIRKIEQIIENIKNSRKLINTSGEERYE